MTAKYGTEIETKVMDNNNSTESTITKLYDHVPSKILKRYCIRARVHDKQQEMIEFLTFTDTIEKKHSQGVLVIKDDDPANVPTFVIEFPKYSGDGSYFIVRSHTEVILNKSR